MNYGIIIPSIIYEKFSNFLKDKPKIIQNILGFFLGIPLFLLDILLALGTPILVLILFFIFNSFMPQTIAFILFELALVGINRYSVFRKREIVLISWQGLFIMINIFLGFWLNNWTLPIFTGTLFIGATIANGISNGKIIEMRIKKKDYKKYELSRKLTEIIFLISTVLFALF